LVAAFKRYDAAWSTHSGDLVEARLELSRVLLAVGEMLPPELLRQMDSDRAVLSERVDVSA
jgi:hypothetical protein